jgi:hypothetical protein
VIPQNNLWHEVLINLELCYNILKYSQAVQSTSFRLPFVEHLANKLDFTRSIAVNISKKHHLYTSPNFKQPSKLLNHSLNRHSVPVHFISLWVIDSLNNLHRYYLIQGLIAGQIEREHRFPIQK